MPPATISVAGWNGTRNFSLLPKSPVRTALVARLSPGARLLSVRNLTGGVSAQVIAFEIERPDGSVQKLVLRRHSETDYAANPNIAADEYKLLQILQAVGIPAPAPIYLDESCELLPTPYLVIQFVEGETQLNPHRVLRLVRQLAQQLAFIHTRDFAEHDLTFLSDQAKRFAAKLQSRPAVLDNTLSEGRIRDALESRGVPRPRNKQTLVHGDYWQGNVLWRDGKIVAVLDWEDAALGDPLADLANARLEILWGFGPRAMRTFTQHYQSLTPLDYSQLFLWDLYAALRPAGKLDTWGLDALTLKKMRRRHKIFVDEALRQLAPW